MAPPSKPPESDTAKFVLDTLTNKTDFKDYTESVQTFSNRLKGFQTVEDEAVGRASFFEAIIEFHKRNGTNLGSVNINKLTARHLEYYCHLTDFKIFVPAALSNLVTDPQHKRKRANVLKSTLDQIKEDKQVKKGAKRKTEGPLVESEGFGPADLQAEVPQMAPPRQTPVPSTSKSPGRLGTKRKSRTEVETKAAILDEVATLNSESSTVLYKITKEDKESQPPAAKSPKVKTRISSNHEEHSDSAKRELMYPIDKIIPDGGMEIELDSQMEELNLQTAVDQSNTEKKKSRHKPLKDYAVKSDRIVDKSANPLPYPKIFARAQKLTDMAADLQSKTATPNSEAPTVKAVRTADYKIFAYSISDKEMKVFNKQKHELSQDDNKLITKWINDGLTHAIKVPSSFTSDLLLKHVPEDMTPNQLAVTITRIENSLALLKFKERMLSDETIVAGATPDEILAARNLSDSVAIDSLVTCVGPVIDYLHSSVEEMRANNEAPRRDLEHWYQRTCETLDSHSGSFEHLTDQVNALIERASNMSMDDVAKVMVKAPSNRKSTMSSLSSASGYSTPHLGAMGPPPTTGLINTAAKTLEEQDRLALQERIKAKLMARKK